MTGSVIQKWNFKNSKFTIIDHRRLSELLVRVFPKMYKIGQPMAINKSINDFLVNLYELTWTDYNKLL